MSSFRMRSTHHYVEAVVNPAAAMAAASNAVTQKEDKNSGVYFSKEKEHSRRDPTYKYSYILDSGKSEAPKDTTSSARTGTIGTPSTPRVGSNARGLFMHTTPSAQADYY